jgi:hypothetical protein
MTVELPRYSRVKHRLNSSHDASEPATRQSGPEKRFMGTP